MTMAHPRGSRWPVLSHGVDLLSADGEDQAHLVATSVPRVRTAQITLGQRLDLLGTAHGRDVRNLTANRVVSQGSTGSEMRRATRGSRSMFLGLLIALDGVGQRWTPSVSPRSE